MPAVRPPRPVPMDGQSARRNAAELLVHSRSTGHAPTPGGSPQNHGPAQDVGVACGTIPQHLVFSRLDWGCGAGVHSRRSMGSAKAHWPPQAGRRKDGRIGEGRTTIGSGQEPSQAIAGDDGRTDPDLRTGSHRVGEPPALAARARSANRSRSHGIATQPRHRPVGPEGPPGLATLPPPGRHSATPPPPRNNATQQRHATTPRNNATQQPQAHR